MHYVHGVHYCSPALPTSLAAIERAHNGYQNKATSAIQYSKNVGYNWLAKAKRVVQKVMSQRSHVQFADKAQICTYYDDYKPFKVTYDSGADGHYISEQDRKQASLPILRRSTKRVGVANGDVCLGNNVTKLPIPQLDHTATEADTFDDFPNSLMSVGKTSDAGTISIFTKDGVTVHKETDVLITCKGKPILIGARDTNDKWSLSHSSGAKKGPMATLHTIQKGQKETQAQMDIVPGALR